MRYFVVLFCVSVLSVSAWGQTVLSSWSFESITVSGPAAAPTISSTEADGGVLAAGSSVSGMHSSTSTKWTTPAGNGSLQSIASDHWTAGDYFQFSFGTTGHGGISITWDQTGSNTGPRDFKVQYSTDGSSFLNASGTNSTISIPVNVSWSSSTTKTSTRFTLDLSGVSSLNNQTSVYIRLVMTDSTSVGGDTVGTTGTSRVDNFTVTAMHDTPLPVAIKGITAKVQTGKVCLNISTASEVDVVGFNILRSTSKDGPYQLISSYRSNPALKTSGSAASGCSYSFVDGKVAGGNTYFYKVESVEKSGESKQVGEIMEVQVVLPKDYMVYQNYPNPFNPTTNVRFDLESDANVMLEVYNSLGAKVKSMKGGTLSAGTHEIPIDMSRMATGVYYYKFIAMDNTGKSFVKTQRMMLVK